MGIKSAIAQTFGAIESLRNGNKKHKDRKESKAEKIANETKKLVEKDITRREDELKTIRQENENALRKARDRGRQEALKEMGREK